jgi:hypothetical protein
MTPSADLPAASPEPTDQDRENARIRQEIAERQAAEYAEAEGLALEVLGPGYKPWMKLTLLDSDHRRTGDVRPVATVYKVNRGAVRLTENSVFLRRMPDGQVQVAGRYEPLFGDLLHEKHPSRTVQVRGQPVPVGRYELCWSALERYEPRTAGQLAQLRATRQRRRQERDEQRWAEENPLLAWAEKAGQQDLPAGEEGRGR